MMGLVANAPSSGLFSDNCGNDLSAADQGIGQIGGGNGMFSM